jgi:putative hydrolase of HD superfamily
MKIDDDKGNQNAQQAHDHLLTLGNFAMLFAQVERAPRYSNGNRENDAEHSFHLALSAAELAADYYPELDLGLVTQFCLVHDLPEIYSGDVWTIGISEENRSIKELAEKDANGKLMKELPPHISQILSRYEKQQEPEARFVRFVDKLMPDIIHIIDGDANSFKEDHKVTELDKLNEIHSAYTKQLLIMFPEFKFIHKVREQILDTFKKHVFKDSKK